MQLEGVVTNVTAFGAFVDIGVHQDGLVHISQLADKFVKDPREVVKAGDVVKVRVTEVDVARKRIALTMKSGTISGGKTSGAYGSQPARQSGRPVRLIRRRERACRSLTACQGRQALSATSRAYQRTFGRSR